MKENVLLLKIIFDFLNQLSEKQLDDLLNKRAKIKLDTVTINDKEIQLDLPNNNMLDEVCVELEEKSTREEAISYLDELKFNKQMLKQLVKHYKIPLSSKATNKQMTEAIIEAVIGSKLRYDALYNTDLNK